MGWLLIGLVIIAPAASPALTMWAGNLGLLPNAYRLILVAGGFALLGLVVFWVLSRFVFDSRVAAFITFFLLLLLTSGGQILSDQSWAWRWVAALVAMAFATIVILRLREWWLLDVIVLGSVAALLLPPILTGVWGAITDLERSEAGSVAAAGSPMTEKPDIILVVVDGYTSLPVLRELFGYEDHSLADDLGRSGFEVVEPAFSSYSMTHFAVSSLLELEYVAEERPTTVTKNGRTLGQVIGGDSYLVNLLSDNGYRITMVEPGWHWSTCGDEIDVCVNDPFIDESVGAVLSQSMLWSFIEPSVGSAFTHGARHAMAWTATNIDRLVNNGISDFAFVHVLAPHPPVFLDSKCQVVAGDRRLGGISLNVAGEDPNTAKVRLEGYVNQVKCVNGFLRDLGDALTGSEASVFVTGDHGSDTMAQLVTDPTQWSDAQIVERMSVFLAVKATAGCENVTSLVTVAMFRALISCVGGVGLDPLEEKAFLVSLADAEGEQSKMRALDSNEVGRLARCLAKLDENLDCP